MRLLLALCLIALLPFSSQADEDQKPLVRISSPELGEQIQTLDDKGLYPDILLSLLEGMENDFDFRVLPLRRLIREMQANQIDCAWAMDGKLLNKLLKTEQNFIESNSVFDSHHIVIMRKDDEGLKSISDLKGKKVALLNGTHMEQQLREMGAIIYLVPDQDTKIRLFNTGRVDAILAWTPDILITMKNYDVDTSVLSVAYKIAATPVKLVCRPSATTKAFIEKVDIAIKSFKADDRLMTILERLQTIQLAPYS